MSVVRNGITDPWGQRTPYAAGDTWPERADVCLEQGISESDVDRWVQTASTLHSNGDALDFAVKDNRIVGARGRAVDRVNRGRMDPKDMYGWKGMQVADRLTRPLIRENGKPVESDWETAMDLIVTRSRQLMNKPGGWGHMGFYTSGQLLVEEYYTLGVIGKAGIGTPHMDGNTRLCTATAAAALKESFGSDGQPGSYTDIDECDAIALWGHNVAETQTVLWMRMLDRRAGVNPPRMLAIDPRSTAVTREADIHLAPRNGTNVALLNCILREVIAKGWYDEHWVQQHTLGFEDLAKVVDAYDFERVSEICDVPERRLAEAAELVGTCERLFSTVLQGFFNPIRQQLLRCRSIICICCGR